MPMIHLTKWLFVVTALLSGCATTSSPLLPSPIKEISPVPENAEPVLFRARPSLKLAPDVAQHDLILQVIGVALPENSRATVGDGLQGALRRSGYQTLFTVTARGTLVSGLMSLSYALLTLDGPSPGFGEQ